MFAREGPHAVSGGQSVEDFVLTEPLDRVDLDLLGSDRRSVFCLKQVHHVHVDVLDVFIGLRDELSSHRKGSRELRLSTAIELEIDRCCSDVMCNYAGFFLDFPYDGVAVELIGVYMTTGWQPALESFVEDHEHPGPLSVDHVSSCSELLLHPGCVIDQCHVEPPP